MKKRLFLGMLIGILISLLVAGGLYYFDIISLNNKVINNNDDDKVVEDANKEGENIKEDNDILENKFYDVNKLNAKTLENWQIFSDLSLCENSLKEITISDNIYVYLRLSGEVEMKEYTDNGWKRNTLNVDNIIDVIKFDVPADYSEQLIYMLKDNGDVYYYKVGEFDKENYNVIKVEDVLNVKKIFISRYNKKNAGGSWALFAITENNDCIMIKGESV